MCGRFVTTTAVADLAERLQVDDVRASETEENYNVTPRAQVAIVAANEGERVLDRVRWGLVPSWAQNVGIGDKLINARCETVREKPAFRRAFAKRRCLIPVDGFYEWKAMATRKAKQPVFIQSTEVGKPLVFAGLYEIWRDKNDAEARWIRSCSIVTTSANDTMAPIHNRMPVILGPEHFDEWLDPKHQDLDVLARLMRPSANEIIWYYPVRTLVNKASNNFAELLEAMPMDVLDDAPV